MTELLKKIIALVISLIIAFVAIEVLVSVLHLEGDELYEPCDVYGHCHKKNAEGWYVTEDSKTFVKTNSIGFVDVEHSVKKGNVTRIAIVGDSFSEAIHVPFDESFYRLLQYRLGNSFEVMSFGVAGYETTQEALLLEKVIMNYRPDFVYLIVFTFDIKGNAYNITKGERGLFSWSKFGKMVQRTIAKLGPVKTTDIEIDESAINITEKLLQKIKVTTENSTFVIIKINSLNEIEENDYTSDKIIDELAQKNEINYISTVGIMTSDDYYEINGHFNANGDKKMSDIIYKDFRSSVK